MTHSPKSARPTALVPRHCVSLGGHGPEDVVADPHGRILTAVEDGRVLRVEGLADPARTRVRVIARTGGRPLGLELLPDGDLLVCDARRGLLGVRVHDGAVRVLADSVAGTPLRFCSNVIALSDGTVYFTVSSRRYPLDRWIGDLVEHTGTGMLLRLAPGATEPEVVLEGLQFANGLAPAADESFLVVAETGARRLTRVRLTGPAAGRADTLAEDLPGQPDNLWREPGGPIWVALAGPRVPALELLHRRGPALRHAAARVAVRAPFRPPSTTGVLAVDDEGRVVHRLERRHARFRMVTSVCVADGRLVLGSIWERGIAVCDLPPDAGHP
ncbi:SMP-30/gluconolactonase/LRE family protein [Streptomyces sp. NPDC005132]|uniref:SMP-30/gluconolactonase/LRE family protein n=1 Tax=Streptomyces sp. NPDC005132 TaxID=3154294 RepID=UPI00339F1E16